LPWFSPLRPGLLLLTELLTLAGADVVVVVVAVVVVVVTGLDGFGGHGPIVS